MVLWDRLAAHRKAERWFRELGCPWIDLEYFPAYCPDLEPLEHIWATTKWGRLANWPAPDIQALKERLSAELHLHSQDHAALTAHFRWAGLPLQN